MNGNTVIFCGDFCLAGDEVESQLRSSPIDLWDTVRGIMCEQSAVVANLECAVTDAINGRPYKWANLKMNPRLHRVLDGLSMAVLGNNHVGDFGEQGVKDTLAVLAEKNIPTVGVGQTLNEAVEPAILYLNGLRLGIVSLCCPTTNSEYNATHENPGVAPLGIATLRQAIEGARVKCDALVAYLHWGVEYAHDPAPDQLRLARLAIDYGADAVVGCHAHVIQSYEQYRGRWIFYGLGNFLFRRGPVYPPREDGTREAVPEGLTMASRESLAVSFRICQEDGSVCLKLVCVQPMRFDDDNVPRPVDIKQLSFDLSAANKQLGRYACRNNKLLTSRDELLFHARLLNGVLTYWYALETINPKPQYTPYTLWLDVARRLKSPVRRLVRFMSNYKPFAMKPR